MNKQTQQKMDGAELETPVSENIYERGRMTEE